MNTLRDLRLIEHGLDVDERALAFCQYAACLAANNGRAVDTRNAFAKRYPHSNYLDIVTRANPLGAESSSPQSGGYNLSIPQLSSAFVEYARPSTILGQLVGVRRAPLNVKVSRATGGTTASWVGGGDLKPVSEASFDTVTLPPFKTSAICVLSQELISLSNDVATTRIAQDLAAAAAQAIDKTFLSKDAATADSPAGILVGTSERASTGSTAAQIEADIIALLGGVTVPLVAPYFVMSPKAVTKLATLRDAVGARVYSNVSLVPGGTLFGIPLIVSANAGSTIALIDAAYVIVAEAGGAEVDIAAEATIDMTGSPPSSYSLFAHNAVGVRVSQYASWVLAATGAAAFISGATYA